MSNLIAFFGGGAIGFLFLALVVGSWPLLFLGIVFFIISLVLGD